MEQSNHDYYDHPVFNPNRLRLKTEAMKKLNEDIHRWLWTGATGGLITGGARVKQPLYLSLQMSYIHAARSPFRHIMFQFRIGIRKPLFLYFASYAGVRIYGLICFDLSSVDVKPFSISSTLAQDTPGRLRQWIMLIYVDWLPPDFTTSRSWPFSNNRDHR